MDSMEVLGKKRGAGAKVKKQGSLPDFDFGGQIDVRSYAGKKIRSLRKEKGLSQEELARLAFTSRRVISTAEQGIRSPSFQLICNIALALSCSPCVFCPPEMGFSPQSPRR